MKRLSFSRLKLGISLFVAIAAVAACVIWLDRPISYAAHQSLAPYKKAFVAVSHIADAAQFFAGAVVLWCIVKFARGDLLTVRETLLARVAVAVFVAGGLRDIAKYAFGRTWPETWIGGNPSLIEDGVYGFFPFHGGPGWASFPSGHETAIVSACACAWILWPRAGAVWALLPILTGIGLVGSDHHFFGDLVGGALLGAPVGIAAAYFGDTREEAEARKTESASGQTS